MKITTIRRPRGVTAILCGGLLLGSVAFLAREPEVPEGVPSALQLEVDLSERVLTVKNGSDVLNTYPVAIGAPDHPTPRGSFGIKRVIWNPRWVPPKAPWARKKTPKEPGDPDNPMGRAKLFFREPDYYLHGTNAEGSLGQAASHGCVRMRNADVIELAQLVMEHGGAQKPESWIRRVINRVRSTQEVRLPRAVPLRVVA